MSRRQRIADASLVHRRPQLALAAGHLAEGVGQPTADALEAHVLLDGKGQPVEHQPARLGLPEHAEEAAALDAGAAVGGLPLRLQQRADKSETEGLQKLRHTRFLQSKHAEAAKEAGKETEGTACPICLQHVDDGLLMQCGHFFCNACTDKLLAESSPQCSVCRRKISKRSLFRVSGNAAASSQADGGSSNDEADELLQILNS